MADFELEPLIVTLAAEFERRGMRDHLRHLLLYQRGYRAQKRKLSGMARPPWTTEMVITWLATFQIAPFEHVLPVLGRGAPCPQCRHARGWSDPAPTTVFPGGSVVSCLKCSARWLVLDDSAE